MLNCTHVVSIQPMKTEKYLCGCAAGKIRFMCSGLGAKMSP